jgi:hypothetical protein
MDYDKIRRDCGSPARSIDRAEFFHLLGVMYPRGWHTEPRLEFFAIDEPACGSRLGDIYQYAIRDDRTDGTRYWSLHAPDAMTPSELLARLPA